MILTDLDNIVYNMFASGEITLAEYLKYENGDKNMNYKEKYKKALERAKKLYEQGTITESLGWVFPEIKESKDERIRKTLIAFFRDWERTKSHCWNINVTDIIAWLEKQVEQRQLHLQEMLHWISVEDELPRCYIPYNNWDGTPSDVLESEKVIALLSDGTICIATFNQNLDVDTDKPTGSPYWFDEGHPEDGDRIGGEVTHWMPMPQQPAVISNMERTGKRWGRIEYGQ